MRLAQTNYDNSETGCCARLDVAKWDGQEIEWKDRPFLKDRVRSVLHIPINMGKVMERDQRAIEDAAAYPADPLWLSEDVSSWRSNVYSAVEHPVPGTETATISGRFLTKVFEGPYRNVGKWLKTMSTYVESRGHSVKRHLFFYATCPKCAKRFGKNQVVLFAQVA